MARLLRADDRSGGDATLGARPSGTLVLALAGVALIVLGSSSLAAVITGILVILLAAFLAMRP